MLAKARLIIKQWSRKGNFESNHRLVFLCSSFLFATVNTILTQADKVLRAFNSSKCMDRTTLFSALGSHGEHYSPAK
jgi:hypothetical protein